MQQILQSDVPIPAAVSPPLASHRPRYLGWASILMIAALVWANTALGFSPNGPVEDNLIQQLIVYGVFCFLWFSLVGLRLSNAVFVLVALHPSVLLEGYGYLFFSFAALSLSELMLLIIIGLSLLKSGWIKWSSYSRLAVTLFVVCAISAIITTNIDFLGQVSRLFLVVWLALIIFSDQSHRLKRALLDGMLLWPITTLAYLVGVQGLWRFLSFGDGRAVDFLSTSETLYGSNVVVYYLFFLIPLLLYVGKKRLILPLLIGLTPYVVFSLSRRLVIALGVAALTYLALNVTSRKKFMSVLIIVLLFVGIAVGVYRVGFFDWSKVGSKQGSNEIRYEKIVKTWDTYLSSPVLGIGYGAVGALDSKRVADSLATDVKASAEFTPLQILAETGTLGGVFSVWLLVFAGRRLLWALRSPGLPRYAQTLLYAWIVVFISDFLGSNFYSSLIYMLIFPVAAYETWIPTFDAASNRPLQ